MNPHIRHPSIRLALLAGLSLAIGLQAATAFADEPQTPASNPPAEAAAAAADANPAAAEGAQRPRKPRRAHTAHRAASGGSALEDRVKLLTAELNLDARQQVGVREALIADRMQTAKIWQDTSVPAPIRIKATQDVARRTEARIRSLLNDEQRPKYIQPKPAEAGKQVPGDAEKWISKMPGK